MNNKVVSVFAASFLLMGCDAGNSTESEKSAKELVNKSIANMIAVKGGEFLMGDFGPLVGENLPFSINQDDKIMHRVILTDFSISKIKVTNADYNEFLTLNNKPGLLINRMVRRHLSLIKDDYSVGVTWQQAKDYCLWLGKVSGKNINLPTEAQWEYAARSEGKYIPFATGNGKFEQGKNIPNIDQLAKYTDGIMLPLYPVGKYPPNPLGLYDMGLSGSEWTNDWYASDYYSKSPVNDPQGPDSGSKKVLRGYIRGDRQYALTMFRQAKYPIPDLEEDDDLKKYSAGPIYVFRCVVNN